MTEPCAAEGCTEQMTVTGPFSPGVTTTGAGGTIDPGFRKQHADCPKGHRFERVEGHDWRSRA